MKHSSALLQPFASLPMRLLPWLLSFVLVIALMLAMVYMKGSVKPAADDTLTIRKIEIVLPPPPPPPPPINTQQNESSTQTPSINVVGPSRGPALSYTDNPQLTVLNLEKITKPTFDTSSLDLKRALTVDFPLFEVSELDTVPRLVSTNRIRFPRDLSKRGIDRVSTQVEIIIDQNGQAFVKKIIDPVYPEMVEVIRRAINDSRFTVPTKEGQAVQAIYLYTLVFVNRV